MIKVGLLDQKCLALILNEVMMCSTPLINIGKPRV
nr:MAG TPA: hypothetical protein [Caudoviricetes sp.]